MKNFFKKIWEWIKTKAKDFWQWLKAWFVGLKWMSKEQYYELIEKAKKNMEEVWEAMDTDSDGWITTKDMIDWFKDQEFVEKMLSETKDKE